MVVGHKCMDSMFNSMLDSSSRMLWSLDNNDKTIEIAVITKEEKTEFSVSNSD